MALGFTALMSAYVSSVSAFRRSTVPTWWARSRMVCGSIEVARVHGRRKLQVPPDQEQHHVALRAACGCAPWPRSASRSDASTWPSAAASLAGIVEQQREQQHRPRLLHFRQQLAIARRSRSTGSAMATRVARPPCSGDRNRGSPGTRSSSSGKMADSTPVSCIARTASGAWGSDRIRFSAGQIAAAREIVAQPRQVLLDALLGFDDGRCRGAPRIRTAAAPAPDRLRAAAERGSGRARGAR